MRNAFSFLWKAAISSLMLYLAFRLVNFAALQERLIRLDPRLAVAGLAALVVQIAIAAVRWQHIALRCGAAATWAQTFKYTLIGTFFNQGLPSTVGGDASRIWLLARSIGHWRGAAYSVLIDRAIGLIWLAVIVLACLPWSLQLITNPVGRIALILIGSIAVGGPLVLYVVTWLGAPLLARWRVTRHFAELATQLLKVLLSLRVGLLVGFLSIVIHLLTVLFIWIAAKGIASPLQFTQALLLIPPVILIAAIPVSIGGWGVREGAMVTTFAYAGLPESDAFAVSVLYGTGVLVIGALGGLVWVVSSERHAPAQLSIGEPPKD